MTDAWYDILYILCCSFPLITHVYNAGDALWDTEETVFLTESDSQLQFGDSFGKAVLVL